MAHKGCSYDDVYLFLARATWPARFTGAARHARCTGCACTRRRRLALPKLHGCDRRLDHARIQYGFIHVYRRAGELVVHPELVSLDDLRVEVESLGYSVPAPEPSEGEGGGDAFGDGIERRREAVIRRRLVTRTRQPAEPGSSGRICA